MSDFIVESALLTHGLKSVSNEKIYDMWDPCWKIAWVEDGVLSLEGIEQFLDFRRRAEAYRRINYFNFDRALEDGASGALTASGTMRVCEKKGIPIAVTCGIGGLAGGEDIGCCNDLRALMISNVSMVATAFKDLFDFPYTVRQFRENGIEIIAKERDWEEGYVFLPQSGERPESASAEDVFSNGDYSNCIFPDGIPSDIGAFVEIADKSSGIGAFVEIADKSSGIGAYIRIADKPVKVQKKALYLNPIPKNERIKDRGILSEAVKYGKVQEKKGKYLHPSVNAKIDELTEGYASEIQLKSLVENIRWAQTFEEDKK